MIHFKISKLSIKVKEKSLTRAQLFHVIHNTREKIYNILIKIRTIFLEQERRTFVNFVLQKNYCNNLNVITKQFKISKLSTKVKKKS